jgi:hypothetical protein
MPRRRGKQPQNRVTTCKHSADVPVGGLTWINISAGDKAPAAHADGRRAINRFHKGVVNMPEVRDFSAFEHLRDGRRVEIRALRPDDEADMLAAMGRTSTQSLQRRFFVIKRGFSPKEI